MKASTPARVGIWTAALLLLAAALPLPGAALELEEGEFDPAAWDSLVSRYVGEAGVDYAAWKKDGTAALDAFLDAAATYDLKSVLGKEPRVAFLANAYNAWAVRQILERYPIESIDGIEGFFDANARRIAGENRTLDAIEAYIAGTMKHDPVALFALAPGASGLPPLAPSAYTAATLRTLATDTAARYLAGPGGLRYDRDAKTLHLPPVLTDHMEILEAQPQGLPGFLSQFLSIRDVMALAGDEYEIRTVAVDRSLHDASGAAGN